METEVSCRKKDMLLVNYEAPDGSKKHNHLWNGGNGWGTVKLYDKKDGVLDLVDEIEATHIGCEYGAYDQECHLDLTYRGVFELLREPPRIRLGFCLYARRGMSLFYEKKT